MNAGGVELSGEVDFDPNELEAVGPQAAAQEPDQPVETAKETVSSVKEEDIHFRAEDINRTDQSDLFVNVAGAKKLAREEKRRKEEERKKALREATKKSKAEKGASKEVREAEKALKREQERLNAESAAGNQRSRMKSFGNFIWDGWHKYVTLGVPIIAAVTVVLIIFAIAPAAKQVSNESATDRDKTSEKVISKVRDYADSLIANGVGDGEDYNRTAALYEEQIEKARREDKFYLWLSYAEYVQAYTNDIPLAEEKFAAAWDLIETDKEREDYYKYQYKVYKAAGYSDEWAEALENAQKYDPEFKGDAEAGGEEESVEAESEEDRSEDEEN